MFARLFPTTKRVGRSISNPEDSSPESKAEKLFSPEQKEGGGGRRKQRKEGGGKQSAHSCLPRSAGSWDVKKSGELERRGSGRKVPKAPPIPSFNVSEAKEPLAFSEDDLAAMSSNYTWLVGKGGFGYVYQGKVKDSETGRVVSVAIKVLHSGEEGLQMDLMREVVAVAQLRHPFILRLIGFCISEEINALVYDYISGGDVCDRLNKSRLGLRDFPWEKRIEVALGCAKALAFMHNLHLIHRDFKPANVLLAEDDTPMVADFGLVKVIDDWHSHCTTKVKGSLGYIDPMYFTIGHVHTKSDVYAFGLFLVELLTGMSVYRDQVHEDVIPDLTRGKVTEAIVVNILDPRLPRHQKVVVQQAKALANLARCSLQDDWESRPTMKDMVQRISRLKLIQDVDNPESHQM